MSDKIIRFDDAMFESELDALVRVKVERIVNAMPDAEADEIANAARYERKTDRKAFRAGHYERTLAAKAGKSSLKAPELKGALFGSAVIERCRRRESSVEEALMEMYLAGVSTRGVDDTGRLLWGERMPSRTLSDKLKKIHKEIDEWRKRPLESEYPYVFVDGVRHKRSRGGHVENAGVLVAIGVGTEGRREAIAVDEGMREDAAGRERFFRSMIERGLRGVGPVVGDWCAGLRLHGQLDAAEREIPAVHGAFHARRALQDAARSQGMGVRRPEGHLRAGKPRIRHGQGRDGRGRNGGTQAQVGREPPARGRRRDRRLLPAGVPREPWDQAAHERHDRAIEQGDPPAHPGRGRLPRLRQRAHARMRRNPLRHLTLVVGPAIHGHVPAR